MDNKLVVARVKEVGRRKVGVTMKPRKRSCVSGTALYLDRISVNILAVIFYQSL